MATILRGSDNLDSSKVLSEELAGSIVTDASGRVTMPYQPMMQSAWTNTYLGMNGDIIRFATDLNIGGHYNTST